MNIIIKGPTVAYVLYRIVTKPGSILYCSNCTPKTYLFHTQHAHSLSPLAYPIITPGLLSPLAYYHPWPIITLGLLSPLAYYHPWPIITLGLLSPLAYYHPWPIITPGLFSSRQMSGVHTKKHLNLTQLL